MSLCDQELVKAGRALSSSRWGSSTAAGTLMKTREASPGWSTRTSSHPCRPWSKPWTRYRSPTSMNTTRYACFCVLSLLLSSRELSKRVYHTPSCRSMRKVYCLWHWRILQRVLLCIQGWSTSGNLQPCLVLQSRLPESFVLLRCRLCVIHGVYTACI